MSKVNSSFRVSICVDCQAWIENPGSRGARRLRCDECRVKAAYARGRARAEAKRQQQIAAGLRVAHCIACGVPLELTNGRRSKTGARRNTSTRKKVCDNYSCLKEWIWLRDYGIPIGTYDRLYDEQDGMCALCFRPYERWDPALYLDHDHQTNVARGLLDNPCNRALGVLGDTLPKLRAVVVYLERSEVASE